jgi:hypothetical protein
MWNTKYLAATLHTLDYRVCLQEDSVSLGADYLELTVLRKDNNKELPIRVDYKTLDSMVCNWLTIDTRVNLHRLILGKGPLDTGRALAYLFLHNTILGQITDAQYLGANLVYTHNGVKTIVKDLVDQGINVRRSYIAAECVMNGYSVKEVMGSHFIVTTPSWLEHIVKLGQCSCDEFGTIRDCDHIHLVAEAELNRTAFLDAGVLTLRPSSFS